MITLKKLHEHHGKNGTHMYCLICNSKYSANPSDYFNVSEDYVFQCCEENMILIQESVSFKEL